MRPLFSLPRPLLPCHHPLSATCPLSCLLFLVVPPRVIVPIRLHLLHLFTHNPFSSRLVHDCFTLPFFYSYISPLIPFFYLRVRGRTQTIPLCRGVGRFTHRYNRSRFVLRYSIFFLTPNVLHFLSFPFPHYLRFKGYEENVKESPGLHYDARALPTLRRALSTLYRRRGTRQEVPRLFLIRNRVELLKKPDVNP